MSRCNNRNNFERYVILLIISLMCQCMWIIVCGVESTVLLVSSCHGYGTETFTCWPLAPSRSPMTTGSLLTGTSRQGIGCWSCVSRSRQILANTCAPFPQNPSRRTQSSSAWSVSASEWSHWITSLNDLVFGTKGTVFTFIMSKINLLTPLKVKHTRRLLN